MLKKSTHDDTIEASDIKWSHCVFLKSISISYNRFKLNFHITRAQCRIEADWCTLIEVNPSPVVTITQLHCPSDKMLSKLTCKGRTLAQYKICTK